MTTQPGIYEGPLPPSFAFGRCVLDVAYASFDSPDDADNLPEKRRPVRAALELTPNLTGAFGAAGTLYGPVGVTLTTENGVFDFWAIDSTNSTVTPAGWSWKAALKVDGVAWSRFEFTPDSTSTDPLNLLDAALLASAATPPAQVSLAEQITRVWDGQINGYQTRTVAGAASVAATTGTWALDLAADTTLTIDGTNGQTVVLDLVAAGHTLTVTDCTSGPWSSDGKIALHKSRNLWAGGSGGGAATLTQVTPTAPEFTDSPDGGGTYTIPTKTGVVYKVGGTVTAAGEYPVAGASATTVTVTAEPSDADKYEIAGGATASWSHTFAKSSVTLIGALNVSGVADGTDLTTLKLQPANISLAKDGAAVAFGGGKIGINQGPGAGTTGRIGWTQPALPKMRITTDYGYTHNDANTGVTVSVNLDVDMSVKNGALQMNGWGGATWTTELDPAAFGTVPDSGKMALQVERVSSTSTIVRAYIDGVEAGRISSANYTKNLTGARIDFTGFNEVSSWITGTLKIEAIE